MIIAAKKIMLPSCPCASAAEIFLITSEKTESPVEKNCKIALRNIIKLDAKIAGITPDIFSFSGTCDD